MKKKIRYSRKLANAELSNTKTVDIAKIKNENNEFITETLKKTAFQLAGVYPYLFDALNMLCTENPQRADGSYVINETETFYHARLSWNDLQYYALGDYKTDTYQNFVTELLQLYIKPESKCFPLGDGYNLTTKPLQIISILHKDRQMTKSEAQFRINFSKSKKDQIENAEGQIEELNSDNQDYSPIVGIEIMFYKPLFEASLLGKKSKQSFLQSEPHLQSKLVSFIATAKTKNEFYEIFKDYTQIQRYPVIYRRYALYLMEHDNKKSDFCFIDAKDMLLHVDPQQLDSDKNIRNINTVRMFVDKANLILNTMAKNGYLKGFSEIPIKCIYNAELKNFQVFYHRGNKNLLEKKYEKNLSQSEILDINKNKDLPQFSTNAF